MLNVLVLYALYLMTKCKIGAKIQPKNTQQQQTNKQPKKPQKKTKQNKNLIFFFFKYTKKPSTVVPLNNINPYQPEMCL